ncbi:SMP-30/gluconolactonase/LRE family protein [Aurantiacibacter hainanensis]|uniref:SMP-30/gluconolactonase/LRE family protein n=1 Tax=Aurantiacibacter hainanensis TaxID=3076114 RepID=UPI0030C6BC59
MRKSATGIPIGVAHGAMALLALLASACATAPAGSRADEPQDIRIAGTGVYPESVTSDSAGNIYVGSMSGTIYRARPGSGVALPWIEPDEANGLISLFGVLVDERHDRLWTCSNPNSFAEGGPTGGSSLVAFTLSTGRLDARYPLPAGPAACNDIAVAPDGTVFATETAGGRIFSLAPGDSALQLFASGDDLVGVDGIAFAGDGTMYINNVRSNRVQRVNRGGGGGYAGLTDLALSQPVSGPDGLRPVGGNRFLQAEGSGGRVALITVEGDRATVTPVATDLDSSPGVTRVGSIGYATEGKIGYLIDPQLRGQDPGDFYVRAFTLPEGL